MSYAKWLQWILFGTLVTSSQAWACQVLATGLSFGPYDPTASQTLTATGFLQLTCPEPAVVRLNAGVHSQGEFTSRQLSSSNSTDQMHYNLFLDPTSLRIWGDGSANTFVHQVPAGVSTLTIYGLIPGGQRLPVGTYTDTISVTIEW